MLFLNWKRKLWRTKSEPVEEMRAANGKAAVLRAGDLIGRGGKWSHVTLDSIYHGFAEEAGLDPGPATSLWGPRPSSHRHCSLGKVILWRSFHSVATRKRSPIRETSTVKSIPFWPISIQGSQGTFILTEKLLWYHCLYVENSFSVSWISLSKTNLV